MLSDKQWAHIHANQRKELEAIVNNRATAERLSLLKHYSNIGKWLPPTRVCAPVLELGCGPGRYVALLGQLGYQVVGVDAYGPEAFPTWKLIEKLANVRFHGSTRAEALPFPDQSFEHVVCIGALLYFDDPVLALTEVRRVLKPGGHLIMRTVNKENFYTRFTGQNLDPSSKNLYTPQELIDFVERGGFRLIESFTYGFWPPVLGDYWWYLTNTIITPPVQAVLSKLTPANHRINIVLMATPGVGGAA